MNVIVDNFNRDIVVFVEETNEILWRDDVESFCSEPGREKAIKAIQDKGYIVPDYWYTDCYLMGSLKGSD